MSVVAQIVADAVNARILSQEPAVLTQVSRLLSYYADGYEHSRAYKEGRWDGKKTFFNERGATFPAGFVTPVIDHLAKLGVAIQVGRVPAPAPIGPSIEECVRKTGYETSPRYAYQSEAVKRLIEQRQIVAQLSTGSGKSNCARIAYWHIGRPTLFLTTRQILAEQMKAGLEAYGERVGVIGIGQWEYVNGFNVGMVQTIAQRLRAFNAREEQDKLMTIMVLDKEGLPVLDSRGKPTYRKSPAWERAERAGPAALRKYRADIRQRVLDLAATHNERRDAAVALLQRFEFVILEEAHEAGSDSYYVVMRACTNAHYRLALTATPFMRQSDEASMRLMAVAGPVGIHVSEKQLIDSGVLARPIFKFIEDVPKPPKLAHKGNYATAVTVGIVENEKRNQRICHEAIRGARAGLSVLVLILRKAHGKILERMLEAMGVRTRFIWGEVSRVERQRALSELASGEIEVLIGSSILDVGVDVPALGMVILGGGGKAEESHRQRIGRGLREKKTGKNVAYIVDFYDKHNEHLRQHSIERRRIIEATPGFAEGILPRGEDFDFTPFALASPEGSA